MQKQKKLIMLCKVKVKLLNNKNTRSKDKVCYLFDKFNSIKYNINTSDDCKYSSLLSPKENKCRG